MKEEALTPMMKQFYDLKKQHPDAVMLFRCGDFYETYMQDAVTASEVLGITLTRRNNTGKAAAIDMAGFPYHALDVYLPKLIRAGHRVAICDQLEDPKLAKKLVKRGITELVTPGVAMSDNVLSSKENNYLAAVSFGKSQAGIALLDISTGEFLVAEGQCDYIDKLLGGFAPKEVLYSRDRKQRFEQAFGTHYFTFALDDWAFNERTARTKLLKHFEVKNLKGFGVDYMSDGISAAGAILQYLDMTQHTQTAHITAITPVEETRNVRLDRFTLRNLEVLQPMEEGGNSLLSVIDRTVSPMGARHLRSWLLFPLCDIKAINERLDGVEYFFRNPDFRELAEEQLRRVGDLERITSKVAVGRATPRDMVQLRYALEAIEPLKEACLAGEVDAIKRIGEHLHLCIETRQRLTKELSENPPLLVAKGGVIADGVNQELDELRRLSGSGKEYLLQIQQRESERTQIPSLKIGFNNVFGYYIEVRNAYKDHVPSEWIRKQTLVNAERYITEELKEYEEKILGAEDKILTLEAQLYGQLLADTAQHVAELKEDAVLVANLDCLLSLATVAQEQHYIRPVVDETTTLDIRQGRHPVIETQMPPGEDYVANDVEVDTDHQQILIITGPNMAGKSALLRQTALIVLLAQVGSFVPAESARIGMVDRIFTRVGASDNISVGESTFMVEMSEASNILNNFTGRSLVLFDELGRGTSTYDGISIAWAIVEYLHENAKGHPRTLFATHYHELNEMQKSFDRIRNFNVSVREVDGQVVFVRKLVAGGSEHSFGIHVAKLAGMPRSIVKRAEVILKELEENNSQGEVSRPTAEIAHSREGMQLSFFQLEDPILTQLRDDLLRIDVNNLTPVEALNKLNEIKKMLKGK